MYDVKPNLVIGFHGCDASVRDLLLKEPNRIVISREPYDWLGHGLYFWENNFERALQWAEDKKRRGKIINPAVIGAVLRAKTHPITSSGLGQPLAGQGSHKKSRLLGDGEVKVCKVCLLCFVWLIIRTTYLSFRSCSFSSRSPSPQA